MTDIIIIGSGPAGISAALYAVRGNLETLIIARDGGALQKAEKIENFYGVGNPVSGKELLERGIKQATDLGCQIINDEVLSLEWDGNFKVITTNGEYSSKSVVMATGTSRATPKIEGLKEFEGRGVSYCATCDGFFFKGKNVAVLGAGEYAVHESMHLQPIVSSVTLLTNAQIPIQNIPDGINVNTNKISKFNGDGKIADVQFDDGSKLDIDGVFVAIGVAGGPDFAKKMGAQIENNKITVDEDMKTNIPGLFSAGDCTGGMLQVAKAVYQGAVAGNSAIKFIRSLNTNNT